MRLLRHRVIRRLAAAIATLLGAALLVFVVLRIIPGDSITASLGTETAALTPEQRNALERYYGLDRPLPVQFFSWLGNVLTGNLGVVRRSGQPVGALTSQAFGVTLELAVLAAVVGTVLGVGLGLLSASRPNGVRDAVGQTIGMASLAVPTFVVAAFVLSIAASKLHYFPNARPYAPPWRDLALNLQQMLFPTLVLGFGLTSPIMRTTRSALLEVQSRDFVRTALGKGVGPNRLRFRHVLRNALIPIVTMIGIQFGYLLGGAVIVEQIFVLPGLGRQLLDGIQQREYALVQSTTLVVAATFVAVNLLTDLLYRRIDPRTR